MQSFVMALRSISANKMRAVLTMLGIIIGVMALVVLVSLVNGATTSVTDKVAELGSSMVSVTIVDDKGKPIGKPAIRLKYKAGVKVRTQGYRAYCQGRYAGRVGAYYSIWEEKEVEVYNNQQNGEETETPG